MSISDSCKAYERYHNTHYQDDPFPISKSKLIRYIKFRARCSTFPEFLTNLDQHPEHGPHWLEEMNSDPDVRKLMDLTINLWPRIAKQCKLPLIGIGNVYETPSFEQKYGKYIRDKVNQEVMYRERVHVVEGKKSKGFMVTDPTQTRLEDTGTSSDSPINLDHPTPIQRFKSTKTSNSPSTASKYTPSTKYAASSTSTATTTTTANKSTSKYDPKLDAIAIRDELMQQMMMPDQMRLVSRFKASATTKAPSKPPSPSVRSVSPSSPPPAPPSSSSSSSKTPKKEKQRAAPPSEPTVKSTSSTKNKPAATKKETTTTTQKKPPVIQKKNPPVNKKSAEKDLWKQAQKVNVRIEKPQDEEEDTVPHQPVVKIVKKKPLHYGTNDDIAPPPPPPPARNSSTDHIKIRHPVVLIKKAPPRRKDPVVKSIEKTPVPYPQQTQDEDEKQDQKRRVKEEKEEEQEQDQHDDNSHRNKRKKRDDYLYDQNRLQIVQIVIENHASSPSVIVPVKKSGL